MPEGRRTVRAAFAALAFACAGATLAAAAPVQETPLPPASPVASANAARAHRAVHAAPAAQAAFDRALAFLWAFSIGEARERFQGAATIDPECVMCRWGAALAETTDINSMQTAEGDARGAAALAEAKPHLRGAPPEERELVEALALRFAHGRTPAQRFHDWAEAMRHYTGAHPNDALGHTVAAYALWGAADDLTGAAGTPNAAALEIGAQLDRALALDPDDLGAHHLRIHLWEDAGEPARASADAAVLLALAYEPGMSHLPHMAGHIYIHTGRFDDVIAANERALANDHAYFALGDGQGQRYLRRYHGHDLDFLEYALTTEGRDADARAAARVEEQNAFLAQALLRDGDPVGAVATPGASLLVRTLALARSGRPREASALRREPASGFWSVAERALADGAIAAARHDATAALAAYARAYAARGTSLGDPKNDWAFPPGEAYGAALLEAGRPAEAERIFRAELARTPNDPRLAYGLAEALRAQAKPDDEPRAAAARAWHGARPLARTDLA